MQLHEIRHKFLDYFAQKGHTIVRSSSLVPHEDPTLLFTNAGMNQFKNRFLGLQKGDYVRATSAQKCVRAGGKHNDLENVGYTARHHTFFEMLGNFSFGDYFKRDALSYAWEFLTKVLLIPTDKLYVTVYYTDDETYDIWHTQIGLAKERIIRIGDKVSGGSDNFWQMGDTGPCGPCSEIFYDHGETVNGGLPGTPDEDGDRYIEIWNCVFMQFNRGEDGSLTPLPKPSVDTGMGIERISAVMQHVHSNYEIDLFVHLIKTASQITGVNDLTNVSLKVLADHIRSVSFLIADGVLPANEGRGYVLRRIIRRAVRHGYKLGRREAFFYKLVNELVQQMGTAYPELLEQQKNITHIINQEELKFFQTIDNGMTLLEGALTQVNNQTLAGEIAFKLYDTYGFPLDLTEDVCREKNIQVDLSGFAKAMAKQKDLARSSGKFKVGATFDYNGCDTEFIARTISFDAIDNASLDAEVVAIYVDNEPVQSINGNTNAVIVLNRTSFYAESGGQIGDIGVLQIEGGASALFIVDDTQKIRPQVFGHMGKLVSGSLKVGDTINATFDLHRRLAIARNHSATHLLHQALHEVLGTHAVQKGSLVSEGSTRFDFAHDKPLTREEIKEIERIVNHAIIMNYKVEISNMSYDEAILNGAMALFDEKYADTVRVIQMGGFSTELCGGTHVNYTGDIGLFTIVNENGIANGIRRIEAVTGEVALQRIQNNNALFAILRGDLKAQNNEIIIDKVNALISENKSLVKEITELKSKLAVFAADNLVKQVEVLANGIQLLVLEMKDNDNKALSELVEKLKDKLVSGIVVIGCNNGDKANLVVGVTKDLTNKYKAGVIIAHLAGLLGGKGGGRPDLAQAGANDVTKLTSVLKEVKPFISGVEG